MSRYKQALHAFCYLMVLSSLLTPVLASEDAALLFLLISPSPEANAMGGTYANTASTSPMAVIFNPACLGFFAQKNLFGVSAYPQKVLWMPDYGSDLNYDAKSTNFGVTMPVFARIPLSFGLAFHNSRLNLGTQYVTLEDSPEAIAVVDNWEEYKGTTLAIALDYYVRLSFGYTFKNIESRLAVLGAMDGAGQAKVKAHDIGFLCELPVYDALKKSKVIRNGSIHAVEPYLNFGFYYCKTNIGDKITYYNESVSDPLPRNLSLGINGQAGLTYKTGTLHMNVVSFKWAREVEDLLVKNKADGGFEYATGLDEIKFWDNVMAGKTNEHIMARRGYQIGLGDCYFFRRGRIEDLSGRVLVSTKGWGIDFVQPLKIAAALLHVDQNRYVKFLAHLSFEKNCSEYEKASSYPLYEMKFKNYVFRYQNLPLPDLF